MNEPIYKVEKLSGPVDIEATVPSSKSVLARALILAALSDGKCTLNNVVLSQDTRAMMVALRDLGFSVFFSAGMKQIRIQGTGGDIPRKEATIFVGNSGTAARFLTAMLALSDGTYKVNASPQMSGRPMKELITVLRKLGAKITCFGKEGHFPIKIEGKRPKEGRDLDLSMDISRSTQFASALLMMFPILNVRSSLKVTGSTRDAYIKMTVKMIDRFGRKVSVDNMTYSVSECGPYKSGIYTMEADVSSACYFYSIPAFLGGTARVNDITLNSVQGDMEFLDILKSMGATIEDDGGILKVSVDDIKESEADLVLDMENFSDQVATMSVLATIRKGKTVIDNIGHIRHQECDRISVIAENLKKCGITVEETEKSIIIHGGKPHGAVIDPHNDHRMAMAFSILGLFTGDMAISDYECVDKTFPDFFDELEKIK